MSSKVFLKNSTKLFFKIIFILVLIFLSQKIFTFKDYSPSIIIESNNFETKIKDKFYQGDKIKGTFKAKHDNLGIISAKFDTHWDVNTDFLQFSIKEKGQQNWYYTNKYKVDQFQNKQYFPFGFPEIANSKNKTYEIEIESLNGSAGNSVNPSPNNEPFLSKYNFSKNFLIQNKQKIPMFVLNKIGSYFRHISFSEYTIIAVFGFLILTFTKSKTGEWLLQYFKQDKRINNNDSVFYWYFWSLVLVVMTSIIVILIKGHYESSEWLIYEIGAVVSFLFLFSFCLLKKDISQKTIKTTLILSIALIVFHLVFLKFYLEVISWRYLIIALFAFIPSIFYNNKSPEKFLKIMLLSLLSLVCISSYFVLDIDSYPLPVFIFLLIISLSGAFILSKKGLPHDLLPVKIVCFFVLSLIVIFSIKKPIEYHHYSYYVGPAYELSHNKSILTEVPSQYGYLSIHFVKTVLFPFGVNFYSFHHLNKFLYVLYFVCVYLIIRKITKSTLISTILTAISISFQTIFSIDGSVLYPSTGPLRFGIGMLIILLALAISNKKKILLISIIASLAVFWSIETAIYIIPAAVFAIICQNYIDSKKIKTFFLKSFKRLILLIAFTIFILSIIFIFEWNHSKTIPDLSNYLQFANAYKGGFGSELIPKFGNYYIAIATILLGLTISIFATLNKVKNNLLFALNFIAIHNVALLSYYISRSNQSNLVNISIFILIELILCYKIIENIFFKNNHRHLFQSTIIPVSIFITFFIAKSLGNIINPSQVHHSIQETPVYIENYQKLQNKYKLNQNNVLVISKDNSSQIISEFKLHTPLPLNPCSMTTLLPNYQDKYITPNINKVDIGTTVVYTKDMPELLGSLKSHFYLKPIIISEPESLFELFVIEKKKE